MSMIPETTNGLHQHRLTPLIEPESGHCSAEPLPTPEMKPAPAEAPSPAQNDLVPELTSEEEGLLATLKNLWQQLEAHGLTIRHQMGGLLNDKLGPPTERQKRGQRVMTLASQRLSISEPDLNRMRWLAHLFLDIDELTEKQPGITTWTAFKEAVPGLIAATQQDENATPLQSASAPKEEGGNRTVRKFFRTLDTLSKTLRQDAAGLDGKSRKEVIGRLNEFKKVLEETLQVRVSITQPRKPAQRAAAAA